MAPPYTLRKRKRTNQLNHNVSPATEMAAGEEGVKQQQQHQSGGVSSEKVESLSNSMVFPPPPPPPRQLLDIAAHESLLKRLGLWEFLNLDLGETIREDLIREAVESYKYNPRKYTGESRVKDVSVSLDRTAVANALRLPVERAAKGGSFPVSEEESLFLEKLFWGHLVLGVSDADANHYVLGFVRDLKELRFEKKDWAGLVWCMMQREMLRRNDSVKCYYASHLQLVLKNQRSELFEDDDHSVDLLENGAKLLHHLQIDLNADIHYSENEDEVHTGDSLHAPCTTLEIDLNADIHSSEQEDYVMQNEAACSISTGNAPKVHFTKEDYVVQDVVDETIITDNALNMIQSDKEYDAQKLHKAQVDLNAGIPSSQQEDDAMLKEANEAVYDTTDNAPKGHCTKDHVVQYEAYGGVSKASTDSALKVHCLKEDDAVLDEGSEACTVDKHNAPCVALVEAHNKVVKEDTSTDCIELLDSQKTENQPRENVKIVENQFKPLLELKSAAEMNGESRADVAGDEMDFQQADNADMEVESGDSVDLLAQEAYDDVGKSKDSTDGLDKIEDQAVHLGSCLENSENTFINDEDMHKKVENIDDLDVEMDHDGGTELGLLQSDMEDYAQKLHKVQNDVPETQQVGGEVEKYVPEGFMLPHCTSNMELDLNLCAEKMKVWTARFIDSARRKVEEKNKANVMLQNKIKEQNHLIEQYEFLLQRERQKKQKYEVLLQKERQQKQTSDYRYNRELLLMHSVVEDYKNALKQTNTSFAKYREHAQLPEEPLYMPHPDGGGNVILVSEWKKLEEERQKMAMKAMVDGFENVWSAYLEEELSNLNQHCDRLEGLEHDVRAMTERL